MHRSCRGFVVVRLLRHRSRGTHQTLRLHITYYIYLHHHTLLAYYCTLPHHTIQSCYMTQVGIIVFLAQIGSYVPCERAKIGIVDQILARISSVESCSVPQSTFQIDLSQVGQILRQSTKRTLVLIDEFGKGTAPACGMSLLASAIDTLSNIGCRTVCTTHFLELFSLNILADNRGGVSVFKMAQHIPHSDDDDAVPLFKLEKGAASSSDGVLCAKMAGLRPDVLKRAGEILEAMKTGKSISSSALLGTLGGRHSQVLNRFISNLRWDNASDEEIENFIDFARETLAF